jgi:hypothetical protein
MTQDIHPIWRLAALLVAVVCATISSAAFPTRAASPPSLHLANSAGHRIAVQGKNWRPNAMVIVTVKFGASVSGLELRASKAGAFLVAADTIDLCGGVTFTAINPLGPRKLLQGPQLKCPTRLDPPHPTWTVLTGTRLHPRVVKLSFGGNRQPVTVHLGDVLAFQQEGNGIQFTPSADANHLSLLQQALPAGTDCTGAACSVPTHWRWAAIATGDATIDLSANCRRSVPACELPDQLIRIHILP